MDIDYKKSCNLWVKQQEQYILGYEIELKNLFKEIELINSKIKLINKIIEHEKKILKKFIQKNETNGEL